VNDLDAEAGAEAGADAARFVKEARGCWRSAVVLLSAVHPLRFPLACDQRVQAGRRGRKGQKARYGGDDDGDVWNVTGDLG
jgi:hypothetical protein